MIINTGFVYISIIYYNYESNINININTEGKQYKSRKESCYEDDREGVFRIYVQ